MHNQSMELLLEETGVCVKEPKGVCHRVARVRVQVAERETAVKREPDMCPGTPAKHQKK